MGPAVKNVLRRGRIGRGADVVHLIIYQRYKKFMVLSYGSDGLRDSRHIQAFGTLTEADRHFEQMLAGPTPRQE